MKTDEVCDRPLDPFGPQLHSFGVLLLLFSFPDKHAGIAGECHQLNRAKGSPEGRRPFGGVKGQRPLGHSFKMNSTPSVPGPQWQEMTPPARVSMTASK